MVMRLLRVGLPVLLSIWLCYSSAVETNAIQDTSDSAEKIKTTFISRVRQVADSGKLFEPSAVADILNLRLTESTQDKVTQDTTCSDPLNAKSFQVTTVKPTGENWFRNQPSGIQHLVVPGHFVNKTHTMGDPQLSYQVFHVLSCKVSGYHLQDKTEASLGFGGLPAFSCITQEDLVRLFTEAKFELATDGVSVYNYQGHLDDFAGTTLQFVFMNTTSCALSVDIRQDQHSGLRYRRAALKYEICLKKAHHDYCSSHSRFTWRDADEIDAMHQYEDSICGTVDSLYQVEPLIGVIPEISKRRRLSEPCDDF